LNDVNTSKRVGMNITPNKKINTPKPKVCKKHSTASLEAKARASWISYDVLLQICSEEAKKPVRDIAELSKGQMKRVEEKIRKEGWRLRK
jgi:hypothetical protein